MNFQELNKLVESNQELRNGLQDRQFNAFVALNKELNKAKRDEEYDRYDLGYQTAVFVAITELLTGIDMDDDRKLVKGMNEVKEKDCEEESVNIEKEEQRRLVAKQYCEEQLKY